ncbi:MAG TPA: DUF5700 domain-containing putative Zn-dependent protease [Pyrinomonadaceae bacterium]|nr:DUF5700 domain-containing putative Zn-dependent protease [Pyrinomonadaceae bacterium]
MNNLGDAAAEKLLPEVEASNLECADHDGALDFLAFLSAAYPKRRRATLAAALHMKRGWLTLPRGLLCGVVFLTVLVTSGLARPTTPSRVSVKVITDEADAVLVILAKKKTNQPLTDQDWQRLFDSEGYVRLKKRETAMKRSFTDEDFKTFVLSDSLAARAPALRETLARWKSADADRSAKLALAYLPQQAHIQAKIYPVIKPRDNSFVFELNSDPAIFLFLDPAMSREKFENYLAHELHHVGYGTTCPAKETSEALARLPQNTQTVIKYIGAFGEGFAMLAAAGGPNVHPHGVSSDVDRARWDRDVANFANDLGRVEKFFLDVLANRLSEEQINATVATFFGEQGAWYTVGWKMCIVIEKAFGRRTLIEVMCDQRKLLPTYNRAAARFNRRTRKPLPLWSTSLIAAVNNTR